MNNYQCRLAKISKKPYIIINIGEERSDIFFPFHGIRGSLGSLPNKDILNDELLDEKLEVKNGQLSGIDIINKLSKYDN